jgi:putative photosynthetic complex assembly protein
MSEAKVVHFPRAPLVGAITLAAVSVLTIGGARLSGVPASPGTGESAVVQSVMLRFEDQKNGGVAVINAETGERIAIAEPGTNGFLRGTLRGLMRVRRLDGGTVNEPFRLEQRANGQLLFSDTRDGTVIDLNAYGQTNAAVFRAFLIASGGNQS